MHFDKQKFLDESEFRFEGIRKGQSIFNEVHQLFPDEVNSITGTVYDCFYLDSKIDLFLEKMRQMVERKEDVVAYGKLIGTTYEDYLNDGKQEIDAEKELWKAGAKYAQSSMDFKAKEHVSRLLGESEEPKVFYRLGESMENRRLRGDKV